MESDGSISIWFFIGISLLVNGVLIFGAGLYQISHPPVVRVVLYDLHASVWWGAVSPSSACSTASATIPSAPDSPPAPCVRFAVAFLCASAVIFSVAFEFDGAR